MWFQQLSSQYFLKFSKITIAKVALTNRKGMCKLKSKHVDCINEGKKLIEEVKNEKI